MPSYIKERVQLIRRLPEQDVAARKPGDLLQTAVIALTDKPDCRRIGIRVILDQPLVNMLANEGSSRFHGT